MIEHKRCPLCSGDDLRVFADVHADLGGSGSEIDARDFGSSRPTIEPVRVVECQGCGLGFRDPRPEADELDLRYRELRDELYVAEEAGRRRACRRLARLVTRYSSVDRGRLLDVGCSVGFFLGEAQEAGWSVFGLEPSRWKAARARERFGTCVQETTLEKAPFAEASFDVVTLWDVLEHVASPPEAVAQAATLLRPGGVLALNVPNISSPIARMLGSRWPLLLPEHMFYFSRRSLNRLLGDAGFEILGFHPHLVYFSTGYVLHRLSQHGLPGSRLIAATTRMFGLARLTVPLLMGEVTAVARLRKS